MAAGHAQRQLCFVVCFVILEVSSCILLVISYCPSSSKWSSGAAFLACLFDVYIGFDDSLDLSIL